MHSSLQDVRIPTNEHSNLQVYLRLPSSHNICAQVRPTTARHYLTGPAQLTLPIRASPLLPRYYSARYSQFICQGICPKPGLALCPPRRRTLPDEQSLFTALALCLTGNTSTIDRLQRCFHSAFCPTCGPGLQSWAPHFVLSGERHSEHRFMIQPPHTHRPPECRLLFASYPTCDLTSWPSFHEAHRGPPNLLCAR